MATTSVHFSAQLVKRLDQTARQLSISRNRLIALACEHYLATRAGGAWPADFFTRQLSDRDRDELAAGGAELDELISSGRRSRSDPLI